jgi:hypothetical protein
MEQMAISVFLRVYSRSTLDLEAILAPHGAKVFNGFNQPGTRAVIGATSTVHMHSTA